MDSTYSKLYPWEWMFREQFGASLAGASTRWIEPPWKAILSNKDVTLEIPKYSINHAKEKH